MVRTSARVFARKVDLTYVQNPNFPIWPGAPRLQIENVFNHAQHGFYANRWHIYEHHGTHMDAPVHFGKNALTIERLPAEVLVAPAAVIDIRDRARRNPDAQVVPEDIRAWERRYGRLPDGAVVFMWSGWGARVGDEAAYRNMDARGVMHFPGFHPDTAAFLLQERNIVGIGVDTLSLDYGASADFKTHYTILPANKWGLENVANLGRIPPAGATVFVGALRIEGASGGPVRLIAVW
ncbi:MAG: cyclase [Thermoflexus sp.]